MNSETECSCRQSSMKFHWHPFPYQMALAKWHWVNKCSDVSISKLQRGHFKSELIANLLIWSFVGRRLDAICHMCILSLSWMSVFQILLLRELVTFTLSLSTVSLYAHLIDHAQLSSLSKDQTGRSLIALMDSWSNSSRSKFSLSNWFYKSRSSWPG